MTLVIRLVVAVVAVVAALLSVPSGSAISLATPAVVSHTYSGDHDSAALRYTATERGPPETYSRHTNYDAVDHWSRGTSRSNEPTPAPANAYDHPALLVPAASATTPTGGLVVVADGDLVSLHRVVLPQTPESGPLPSART